ncbi:MAG: hypothetical protein KKA07_05350, partial [Bacteroidetes bacterium]|nr:hypothetical protein [Bacteroidota bacterium]
MKRFQFFILILIFGLLFFPECSAYCQDKPTLSDVKVSSISEGILTSLTVAPSSSEYHFIIRIYDEEGNFIFDGYSAGINKIVPADSKKSQKIEILSPYIYFQKSGKIKLMVHIEEETDAERGDYQYVSQNRYLDDIPPLKKLSEQQFTVLKSDVKANSKLDGVNGVLLSYIVKFSNPDFLIFREKADDDTHYYFTVHVADEQGFPVYFPDLDFKSSASSSYCRKVLARKEKDTSKVSFFIPYFLMTAPPGDYNLSFRLQVTDVAQKIAFPSPASVEAKVKLQALSVLSLDLDTFEVTGSSKSKTTPDYGFTVSCGAFVRNDPADKKFWKPIFFIAHPDDEFRISLTDKNVTSGNNSSGEIKFKVKDANPEIKKDKATASNVKYNKLSITKRPFQYFDRGKQVLSDQAGKTGDVSGVYSSLQYDLGETVWSKEMKIYPILAGKSEIERMFPYLVYENGVQTAYSTPEWRPSARNEEDNKTGQFDVMVPNIALNENGKAIGYEFQFGPGNVQYVFGKNYYTAGKTNDIIIRDVLNTLSYDNTTECNYVRIEFETEIPNFYMKNGTIRTFYTMSDEKHPETYKILFDNHLENGYYSDFQGMANNNNIDIS